MTKTIKTCCSSAAVTNYGTQDKYEADCDAVACRGLQRSQPISSAPKIRSQSRVFLGCFFFFKMQTPTLFFQHIFPRNTLFLLFSRRSEAAGVFRGGADANKHFPDSVTCCPSRHLRIRWRRQQTKTKRDSARQPGNAEEDQSLEGRRAREL